MKIKVLTDFSKVLGARYYSDGPFSGTEFFDRLLSDRFSESIKKGEKLEVDLDGTEGYASSFINEAFRLLAAKYGPDHVSINLIIISNEVPKYKIRVKEAIDEARK